MGFRSLILLSTLFLAGCGGQQLYDPFTYLGSEELVIPLHEVPKMHCGPDIMVCSQFGQKKACRCYRRWLQN